MTTADLERVLTRYLIGKPAIVMSVVPRGKPELAAKGGPALVAMAELDRSLQPEAGRRRNRLSLLYCCFLAIWH